MNTNVLGLGLDYQYVNDYSFGGMKGICNTYRDRLSHVSIVNLSNLTEASFFINEISQSLPTIHHLSGIAPANPFGPDIRKLELQSEISDHIKSFWCLEDIGIWSIGPYAIPYFAPPIFDSKIADLISARIKQIMEITQIPFLAEIPSCSFVVGTQSLGDFFHQIINATNCKMVLDVSHVFSYALATNNDAFTVLHSLPLDAVWEMHIAGGRINPNHQHRYIDTHSDPIMPEVIELMVESIKYCKNLRAITYEIGVASSAELIDQEINKLIALIDRNNFKNQFA